MDTLLTLIETAVPSKTVHDLCFPFVTKTEERQKLQWVTDASGKRQMKHVKVIETRTVRDSPNNDVAINLHMHLFDALTDGFKQQVHPHMLCSEQVETFYKSCVNLLGMWLADTYASIRKANDASISKLHMKDKTEKLQPLDELPHSAFLLTVLLPHIQELTTRALEDHMLSSWVRFLNLPPFHWHDKYEATIHPALSDAFKPHIKTLSFLPSLKEALKAQTEWFELAELVRIPSLKENVRQQVLNSLWSESFLQLVQTELTRCPTLEDESAIVLRKLLLVMPKEHTEALYKMARAHIDGSLKDKELPVLVQLNLQYEACMKCQFTGLPTLHKATGDAFRTVLGNESVVDGVVKALHALLRSGPKQPEQSLKGIEEHLKLAAHIPNKDLFLELYMGQMGRRLLAMTNDTFTEGETAVLVWLKTQIGFGLVHRLETIYKDIVLQSPQTISQGPHSLRTLNTAAWPVANLIHEPGWNVPKALLEASEEMKKKVGKEKKLVFLPAHDSVTLNSTFGGKQYTLVMTSIQASILLAFDELGKEALTFKELEAHTGIRGPTLKGVLHSLHAVKTAVPLLTFKEGVFRIVDTLNTPLRTIKVPAPPYVEKKEEVVEKVEQGREYVLDSAIVRVLKTRKEILLQELQMEVMRQISHLFQPRPAQIKQRVESLIEREYCRRDEETVAKLVYVA